MRSWVLIAALAAICLTTSQALTQKEQIRSVLKTWRHGASKKFFEPVQSPVLTNIQDVDFFSDEHHISKRSINSFASAVTRGCTKPGYTGETCQYPLCVAKNPYVPTNVNDDQVQIDAQNLANCSETMVVLVDETMWEISISLESESPLNPTFYLQGEDGTLYQPDSDSKRNDFYKATYNLLPPGQYLVGPRADTGEEFCIMMMSARTSIKVSGGFTSGDQAERNDYPVLKLAYFDTQSVFVVNAQNLAFPGQLQGVGFTGAENHITRYLPLGLRYNCTYPYTLERYTCARTSNNDAGHNFAQVEGVTNTGFKFRRIVAYQCVLPPVVSTTMAPSTTPTPVITSCKNGGQVLKDPSGAAYCYCFGLFTGADCGQMLCANGGVLDTNAGRCKCAEGFMGFHCENIVCTDPTGVDFDAEHPTITLVFRSRTQLSNVIQQATDAVSEIVELLSFEPDYLSNFIVVLFDNNKLLSSKKYSSWGDALIDLTKAIHSAPTDGGCEDAVFSSIASALSLYPTNKSPVYIVTDANPNDSAEKETVFHLESYWRAPLYFIYVSPAPGDGCNSSPDSAGYRDFTDMAIRTSGNTFYIADRTKVQNFMFNHMKNTLFRSQLFLSADYSHCGQQNLFKSVAVDQDTDMLVIVATGNNLSMVLTDPFQGYPSFETAYNDGQNYIWIKRAVVSGQWFFTLLPTHNNDACTFKVYQKKYNAAGVTNFSPDYDVFWAFASTLTSSGHLRQPVLGFDAAPVFHISNTPYLTSDNTRTSNLQIYAIRDGKQVEVYGSNGLFRDACEYSFYFPPFTCRVPDETLYFNFYTRDRFDMTLQRAGTMYCSTVHPTPQPDHACQNGGVMNPSNTTCFCTPQFSGQYCQNIVCFNGGTPNGAMCQCPPGYAGESCELARCTETGPNPAFLRLGVDMIFAVEITQNSVASIAMLNANFQEILRDIMLQNRGWIRNVVLVGFNSTWGGPIAESPVTDLTNVINALNTLASSVPTDTGCLVKLWDALNHAIFSREVIPGSYIEIFQTTPEDDTDTRSLGLFYEMSRSMDLIIYGFLTLNQRIPNGFVCNATAENYYTLLGIVGGSTGATYALQANEISNAVRLIPLQYSNGMVGFNFEQDCRFDDGMITYFPVDAYTQTIQLNVFGYGTSIDIFSGDGTQQTAIELFYDTFTGQGVYEVRKQCDDGWEPLGQYCIKFIVGPDNNMPWPQARNFCISAGGFLADDLSDDKNTFLYAASSRTQFWLGLSEKTGNTQFFWDRGNQGDPSPLNQANTYWADGNPGNDATKQCVYFDGQSGDNKKVWTADSCSTPRAFVCQKHRYDQDHRPNVIGSDDLPAGLWYAKLKSAPPAANPDNSCSLVIRVQSDLQIVTGFTTSIGSDYPQNDPIQDSPANRMITYVHSVDNQNRAPILTDAILWDAYNGSFYNGLKYQPRFACQYGWVTQDFPCPNGSNDANEFGIIHIGEDEFGNAFQRLTYGHCSKAQITCGNGGIRQNGVCVCNDYWTGSLCTVPICVNGGTKNTDERTCSCPDGYTGQNCQFEMCLPGPVDALFSNNRKTFMLMVETTVQNRDTANQLVASLAAIIDGATQMAPLWFSNYALVTFDSTGRTFEKFNYTNINDVITDLTAQVAAITDAGSCNLPYLGVIAHLMEHDDQINIPNSEFFLVTSAAPSDLNNYREAMETLFNSQAHLHFISSDSGKCPAYQNDGNSIEMAWLGYGSSGNILFTDPQTVAQLLQIYVPTLYGASILQDPTGINNYTCENGDQWYVPVDMNTTFIYVSTTSEFGSVSAKNALGQTIQPTMFYNHNSQKLYAFEVDRVGGIWSFSLASPGMCYAHVYSVGGPKVYTKFALTGFVGKINDPNGAHQDGRIVQPVPGVPNVAVFHLSGPPYHNGQLQYVEIFDIDTVTAIMRSELYPRVGCSYEYYSDPFTCNSDMLAVFVHGVDESNQKFRRQEIIICNGRAPPTMSPPTGTMAPITVATQATVATQQPPVTVVTQVTQQPPQTTTQPPITQNPQTPPSTTQASGTMTTSRGYPSLQFDVIFLIDGSQAAQNSFDSFTKFIQTLMVSFNVAQAGARVGIMTVTDEDFPPAASLDSINSQMSLNGNLATLKDNYADFDHPGQLLTYNLGVAMDPQFMAAGYRTTITNHLLIYITSTTAFDSDPTQLAQTIIAGNTYGIITVGYGPGVDNNKLQAISGGAACSFTANDFAGLNNQIKPIQQLIWTADVNGGMYCKSP